MKILICSVFLVVGWLCATAGFVPLHADPCAVVVEGADFTNALERVNGEWTDGSVRVRMARADDGAVGVWLKSPQKQVESLRIRWKVRLSKASMMLTDDWCGLGWAPIGSRRDSAWYFLVEEGGCTHGYGVMTRPNAIVYWKVSPGTVEGFFDVSAGGEGVRLGMRELEVCRVVSREGIPGESSFAAGRAFCRQMCPDPRLPKESVYAYNDWYCAYGANTATNFLEDAAFVVSLAEGLPARPFVVMDDGWQVMSPPEVERVTGKFDSGWGPWDRASHAFGMDMPEFASRIASLGAKPGLWYRPLRAWDAADASLKVVGHPECFDPTMPENLCRIRGEVARFRDWGFRLVKVDFLAYDVIGQYLFPGKVGERVMADRRVWRDCTRTTAERIKDVHQAIRDGAGDGMVVIGCGTFGHLAAGFFEVNRIGFDTSGRDWGQTARNGPGALSMRSIQHNAFYAIDGDCVGLASRGAIPWEKNQQWMDLLSRSKTPFFISWRRSLADDEVRTALRNAFSIAAAGGEVAEPIDWKSAASPCVWRFSDGTETHYSW